MDLISLLLAIFVFMLFFVVGATLLVLIVFQQEIWFLPRRYYNVELYNRVKVVDEDTGKEEQVDQFSKAIKGWVVSRKGVQFLRIHLGGLAGVDLDIGYMRHMEDNKIELLERIPGVKAAPNFVPLHLSFEVEPRMERDIRGATTNLTEIATKLISTDLSKASTEELQVLKGGLINVANSLNTNMDKVLDMDRRLQSAQVSGWGEFQASGMEKSNYRVQKQSALEKYLPYIAMFAVMMTLIILGMIGADMFTKTTQSAASPVISACTSSENMFTIYAKACGWTPDKNTSLIQPPPGVSLPTGG